MAPAAAGVKAGVWADYDPVLSDRPPFDRARRERTFGLVRSDNSLKPAAEVFRSFAGRACAERIRSIDAGKADEYYAEPARRFAELYTRYP